jgi:hypothetical protein
MHLRRTEPERPKPASGANASVVDRSVDVSHVNVRVTFALNPDVDNPVVNWACPRDVLLGHEIVADIRSGARQIESDELWIVNDPFISKLELQPDG